MNHDCHQVTASLPARHRNRPRSRDVRKGHCESNRASGSQAVYVFSDDENPQVAELARLSSEAVEKRPPRRMYTEEQLCFIWYHRTDLKESWTSISGKFEAQFHQKRDVGALECRFYRILKEWNVENVREQSRMAASSKQPDLGRYGVIQRTWWRYPWMLVEHHHASPLPDFIDQLPPRMALACCLHYPRCRCGESP